MEQIYGFDYDKSRYNEDEEEMEYLIDGEWMLESDVEEMAEESQYWNDWAQELWEMDGNLD